MKKKNFIIAEYHQQRVVTLSGVTQWSSCTCAFRKTEPRPKPTGQPWPFACELVHSCRSLQTLQHVLSLRNTLRGFAKLSSYSWDTDTRCARGGFVQDTSQSRPIKQWAALSLPPEEEGDVTIDEVPPVNNYSQLIRKDEWKKKSKNC